MNEFDLNEAVRNLAVVFERRKIRHALIGGLAVGKRTRPRATKDADFILEVPALSFPGLLEDLVEDGFEIDVVEIIRRWSADRLVVFYRGEVRIDWVQPVVALYSHVLNTASSESWLDTRLNVATAEGLILTKMVAFRPQDQVDIESLLISNRDTINLDSIRTEWAPFVPTEQERNVWLEQLIGRTIPSPS